MAKDTEACGRCSMTVVVDAVDDEEDASRDPFDGERIEVEERDLERVSPAAWMGRVSSRVNEAVGRLVWGR
ncbi:hypothetical protein [Natronomonas marina]|jgi:hypothetical protein|uniref:hypothetical protein n=1 Tax=Natronomonas marina TaxID=2961939 RepID=UPI0020C9DA8B|nr:hypothetical protein [Natronomonas marina]